MKKRYEYVHGLECFYFTLGIYALDHMTLLDGHYLSFIPKKTEAKSFQNYLNIQV
jgi:hypothetical protein